MSTAWLPGAVAAAPSGAAAPPGPVRVTLVNFSSTPSLNSSRISLGGETALADGGRRLLQLSMGESRCRREREGERSRDFEDFHAHGGDSGA